MADETTNQESTSAEITLDNAETVTSGEVVTDPMAGIELPDPEEAGFDPIYAGEMPDEASDPGRAIMPTGPSGEIDRPSQFGDFIGLGRNFVVFERDTPFEMWGAFFSNLIGRLEFADKSLPWVVGDALNFALHHYPEDAYSQFLSEFKYSYGSLRNMAYVAGRWAPADRDPDQPWGHYYITAGLRKEAPALAAAMVKNAGKTGANRRELQDQANQASRQVRADRKAAPVGQLDEPKIETEIHRPGCPTCTCVGPKVLGKPGKLSPKEAKRVAASKNGKAEPAKGNRGRKVAAVVTAAPKPIGTRKGRRGRPLEPNPSPVQVVDASELPDDAEPFNGNVAYDDDNGRLEVGLESVDDREPDPAGVA